MYQARIICSVRLYSIARLCHARGAMHNMLCMLCRAVLRRAMQLPYRKRAEITSGGACPWAMRGAVLMITGMPSIPALTSPTSYGSPGVLFSISKRCSPHDNQHAQHLCPHKSCQLWQPWSTLQYRPWPGPKPVSLAAGVGTLRKQQRGLKT